MLAHSPMRVHFELGEYKNWPGRVEFCIEHIRDICFRASAQKIVSHTIIVMQNIKKVIVVTAKKSHYHAKQRKVFVMYIQQSSYHQTRSGAWSFFIWMVNKIWNYSWLISCYQMIHRFADQWRKSISIIKNSVFKSNARYFMLICTGNVTLAPFQYPTRRLIVRFR